MNCNYFSAFRISHISLIHTLVKEPEWEDWGPWIGCDPKNSSANVGKNRTRERNCTIDPMVNGGKGCKGKSAEVTLCPSMNMALNVPRFIIFI